MKELKNLPLTIEDQCEMTATALCCLVEHIRKHAEVSLGIPSRLIDTQNNEINDKLKNAVKSEDIDLLKGVIDELIESLTHYPYCIVPSCKINDPCSDKILKELRKNYPLQDEYLDHKDDSHCCDRIYGVPNMNETPEQMYNHIHDAIVQYSEKGEYNHPTDNCTVTIDNDELIKILNNQSELLNDIFPFDDIDKNGQPIHFVAKPESSNEQYFHPELVDVDNEFDNVPISNRKETEKYIKQLIDEK